MPRRRPPALAGDLPPRSKLALWQLTVTLNVFFSPDLVNSRVPRRDVHRQGLGASTLAVYFAGAGPTLVTIRFTVKDAGRSSTLIVG